MYISLAELILQSERNDYRFERMCMEVVGKQEGVTFLPTSTTWDLGRDARSMGRGKGSHPNILCATLNEQIDAKVEADLLRLTALSSPDRIVYCSSQKLSEHRIDQIAASIRRHSPNGSVEVYGATQLAALADLHHDIFEKHYGAEMQDIRAMVLSESPSGAATAGMRLALLTFGSAEGTELRDEVLRSSLLDKLSSSEIHSGESLVESFSADIGLSRALSTTFFADALQRAHDEGLVLREQEGWRLTEKGEETKRLLPLQGAEQLLAGRAIVREAIETLIGKKYSNQQYSLIWTALVDVLAQLFHSNGLEILANIDALLVSPEISTESPLNLKRELENGMKRVAANIITSDLRNQTYRALLDTFTEREGPAFEWLTRVAERFVTLCTIGLERQSGEAIRETLTSQSVVLDSDIILDYLCTAEPDHKASRDLLVNWLAISGKILVSPIILEEVAHNAWISERDFRETEALLGKLRPWELRRYIQNPFVRTFHSLRAPASRWPMFIGTYRGNSPGDYSKLLTLLRQRLKVEVLPAKYDENLSSQITNFLRRAPSSFSSDDEHLEDVLYKVERDGKFLSSVASARSTAEASGFELPLVILSSSNSLRAAEIRFRDSFGDTRLVLNKRAFSYLLSTVPRVSLGADTLRRALFTFGSYGRLRSDGTKALRLIRASSEVDVPWAERFTLRQELSRVIRREADRRGMSKRELTDDFVEGGLGESAATIIAESIRNLAIPSNTEKELAAARRRIAELESQVAGTKSPTAGTASTPRRRFPVARKTSN